MNKNTLLILGGIAVTTLTMAVDCLAQNIQPPLVTIQATDALASRSGDPAEFTVFRAGDPLPALNLFLRISGTAENGVDYEKISNWLSIPSGGRSAVIKILPLAAADAADLETIILELAYPPTMPPLNYGIGEPHKAMAYIGKPPVENLPPVVRVVSPLNGISLFGPTNINLVADARDPNPGDYVEKVEFFANGTSIGVKVNNPMSGSPMNPFILAWENVLPGDYKVMARATDKHGASTDSLPIAVHVKPWPERPTIVEIVPTQPNAAEPCGDARAIIGKLTVSRNSHTEIDLKVLYTVRGTAVNGTDYDALPGEVMIPKGALTADIDIRPLADTLTEGGESVAVQVVPPVCPAIFPPPPECYLVGRLGQAVVFIKDCQGPAPNQPPMIRLTAPPNGAVFRGPLDIPLFVYAHDRDGTVTVVEFFANDRSLGLGKRVTDANRPEACMDLFTLVWDNAPVGTYVLTAKATDDDEAVATSEPVKISVLDAPPPPPERPNLVSIVAIDPIAIEGTGCWPWIGAESDTTAWEDWVTTVPRVINTCGPKNAAFAVRRAGATNEALQVGYTVGGTGLNGVDYVGLPGTVTIPEGKRQALITIVPLDAGDPHTNRTVVLKLKESPDYLVGRPAAAAVLIVDSENPRWFTGLLPGSAFHLNARGPNGAWFRVESSTDLATWTAISTNQVVNGSVDFIEPETRATRQQFYRAVPEVNPPPQ